MKNLSYIPEKQELVVDMPSIIDMTRDTDIQCTKQKYSKIHCKIMMPETMMAGKESSAHKEEIKKD